MASASSFLRSLKQETRNILSHLKIKPNLQSDVLKELDKSGIVVIPGFYNAAQVAQLKQDVLEIIARTDLNIFKDDTQSDTRAFGANHVSEPIEAFCSNRDILDILETYEGRKIKLKFTMANYLIPKEGNKGSGAGWHRDAPRRKQTKAFLYLTDVDSTSGPFQFIKGTHKPLDVLKHQVMGLLHMDQKRITDEEVETILKNPKYSITEVTAKAGDLILADTRAIHRGKPIVQGERIALTNYYFAAAKPLDHFFKVFIDPKFLE